MSGIMMMVIAIVVLGGAYLLYGRYLQNKWGIDPKAKTPAYEMEDGVDYVPADTNVVFGHQFASIAGAGPIIMVCIKEFVIVFVRSVYDKCTRKVFRDIFKCESQLFTDSGLKTFPVGHTPVFSVKFYFIKGCICTAHKL